MEHLRDGHVTGSLSGVLCRVPCFLPAVPAGKMPQYPVANSSAKFAASMTRMFYYTSLKDRIAAVIDLIMASIYTTQKTVI